jgi:hypothetical protein
MVAVLTGLQLPSRSRATHAAQNADQEPAWACFTHEMHTTAPCPPCAPAWLHLQYYESTPASWATKQQGSSDPATTQASASLLTWVELYSRMAARTQPPPTSQGQDQSGVRGPKDILRQQQQGGSGQGSTGQGVAPSPVYDWYHVTRLGSRTWGGHGAFWSLDPRNPEAIEAMKQVRAQGSSARFLYVPACQKWCCALVNATSQSCRTS